MSEPADRDDGPVRDYYRRNPQEGYCRAVISPKVAKFRQRFAARLRS